MSRIGINDAGGDAVGSGDNGGFRSTFGRRAVSEIAHHHPEHVDLGAEPLAAEVLVDTVLKRLAQSGIDITHISIDRTERDLVLRGEVESEEQCSVAESVALGTPGVEHVVTELRFGG